MAYIPRILDSYLVQALEDLPAIALDGCKGVGKTATSARLARSRIDLDQATEIQALEQDPGRITRFAYPLLIDEWQLYPAVWDRVRRAVDESRQPGMFLLTGSATPIKTPKHSGAGRIIHVQMRPFSLAERQLSQPVISLNDLCNGTKPQIGAQTSIGIQDYANEIVAGGLPALRDVVPRSRRAAWDGYLAEVLDRDLPELGQPVRRRDTLRAWLRSYAAATSTIASYTDILDNAMPNDAEKPSKPTTIAWRELLHRIWLLDPLPAWDDPLHHISRLGQSVTHHLADPALAAHLLGLTAETLLTQSASSQRWIPRSGTPFGALFESLVTLSVRVYAEPLGFTVSHLRTRNGDREVDLIVTRPDGKCVALEIKSTPQTEPDDLKHLHWLQAQLGDDLLDSAIINTGPAAYRRSGDGIAIIPAVLLGP